MLCRRGQGDAPRSERGVAIYRILYKMKLWRLLLEHSAMRFLYKIQVVKEDSMTDDDKLVFTNAFELVANDSQEAADLQFRADVMLHIRKVVKSQGWKQAQVSEMLGISQPEVSNLLRGKVRFFSSDKLIGLLSKLGYKVTPEFILVDV